MILVIPRNERIKMDWNMANFGWVFQRAYLRHSGSTAHAATASAAAATSCWLGIFSRSTSSAQPWHRSSSRRPADSLHSSASAPTIFTWTCQRQGVSRIRLTTCGTCGCIRHFGKRKEPESASRIAKEIWVATGGVGSRISPEWSTSNFPCGAASPEILHQTERGFS